ncbi:MAG: D-alanyl-D-alanine carboxypeptidase/D-alanyl-D-alanine-endopeptidase, partial [Armatimonadota bacterium]
GELFAFSPNRSLLPASTMKLFTAVFVLETLGAQYRPRTTAWRHRGTVYLQGGGDPGLTVEELLWLAQVLEVRPEEDALFDDSLFGKGRIGPGWDVEDLHRGYAAQVSPLTVNGGKATLMATAGKAWLEPRNFGVRIMGTIAAGAGEVNFARDPGSWTLRVWGRAPEGEVVRVGSISLPDPGLCAARIFHARAERALAFETPRTLISADSPGVRYPIGAVGEELVFIEPRTVSELLARVLQDSDNAYAETLLRLAAVHHQGNGEWSAAAKAMEGFARRIGIAGGELRVADGCGLSRQNRVSAKALTTLLRFAAARPYFETLLERMARPGVGTLKKRLDGVAVSAKTG